MATEEEMPLGEAFEKAFIAPFASHRWRSRRARSHWVDLEGWQSSMAGPIDKIVRTGGCEYVYSRTDWYFATVEDPESLRRRLLEWHVGLAAGVERFIPANEGEAEDLAYMRSVAEEMRSVVERACAAERDRWTANRG